MKSDKALAHESMIRGEAGPESLVRQTLRTVAVLVGASVLFVGALSVVAVTITSKAVGEKPSSASQVDGNAPTVPAAGGAGGTSGAPKKPMSI